ncbi:MAG TPA: hypothetical protein VGR57_10120 [Ktedonobacterales bacterium]|nr:hypothetical protein [Ktedonobacterales bacterium]
MSEESEERQRRIQALHELAVAQAATGQLATAPVRPRAPRRRAGGRTPAIALALLCLLLLASGSAWYVLGHRAPTSAPTTPIPDLLTLDLAKDHLTQPLTVAWSPDGRSLAVLAYVPAIGGGPQVVGVFDGRTGKLTRRFALDTILAAQGWSGYAFSVTWQPDGQALALPFTGALASNPSVFEDGLLLLPLHGSTRLLTAPSSDPNSPRDVWDLAAGRAVPYGELSPQALTYRFDADGHITPNELMRPTQAPGEFTGSPVSDPKQAAFSRWQAGTLDPLMPFGQTGRPMQPPTDELLASYLPQWSADGRFMAFGRIVTRVNVHGATSAPVGGDACARPIDINYAAACRQPAAALPDRALQTVLSVVQTGQSPVAPDGTHLPTNWSGAPVSWRPDGKVLAAILPADGYFNEAPVTPQSAIMVTLLSTTTGQPLATLSAPRVPGASTSSFGGFASLVWSPRGEQLAYVDYAGRITIWGGATFSLLPR